MAISKGIQTSEFALVVVVNIASFVGMIVGILPPKVGLLVVAGINSVYTIMRSLLKIFDPTYVPPELPPLPVPPGTISLVPAVGTTTTVTTAAVIPAPVVKP